MGVLDEEWIGEGWSVEKARVMASHSGSYWSCNGCSGSLVLSLFVVEWRGISNSWRKSRRGRHLSNARKWVRLFVIVVGGSGWGIGGGGLVKEAGSWARRASGIVL